LVEEGGRTVCGVGGVGGKPSLLQLYTMLDDPLPFVKSFFKAYPLAMRQLLASEDTVFFLPSHTGLDRNLSPSSPFLMRFLSLVQGKFVFQVIFSYLHNLLVCLGLALGC